MSFGFNQSRFRARPRVPGAVAVLTLLAARAAWAVPTRDASFLDGAPRVSEVVGQKEFFVNYAAGAAPWRELEVFVVVREVEDPLRKGWFDFTFVGRAAVAETSASTAHMVLYKPFKGEELKAGDRLVRTGDPLTLEEMDLLRKEVIGVLHRDKELEDLYSGLISFKFGLYSANFSTSVNSGNDTNSFKQANGYTLTNLGIRWWFFFNPAIGVNFEYASGTIPTIGFKREPETSSQTYVNPGLMYRGRFLVLPTIYSITYFINRFNTTNPDDLLISSTYSGPLLGMTFYLPYRTELFRLGPFNLVFNNLELGAGYAPTVNVTDEVYKRGTSSSNSMMQLQGGIEFNLAVRGLHFTNDLFIILEGGMQKFNLSFSGQTTGNLPGGQPIPGNSQDTESQVWYGIRLKYNFRDVIGEMLYGL